MVIEKLFQQFFVSLGCGFDHPLTPGFGLREHILRDFPHLVSRTHARLIPVDGFHANEIDNAFEILFGADRQLDGNRIPAKAFSDLPDHAQEISSGTVHFVDEDHSRHIVFIALAPDSLGLRLYTADRTKNRDGSVKNAQAALHLDRKIDVSRRVDDIDAVLFEVLVHSLPETGCRSGRDRNATLLLLFHPVHNSCAIVNFAHLVRYTRIKQNALGRGRLARIDVRHDADIAVALDRCFPYHGTILYPDLSCSRHRIIP